MGRERCDVPDKRRLELSGERDRRRAHGVGVAGGQSARGERRVGITQSGVLHQDGGNLPLIAPAACAGTAAAQGLWASPHRLPRTGACTSGRAANGAVSATRGVHTAAYGLLNEPPRALEALLRVNARRRYKDQAATMGAPCTYKAKTAVPSQLAVLRGK